MTNRQKLLKENLYDLLCRMNDNITQCNVHDETPCIMAALGEPNRNYYCKMYSPDFNACIATYLGSERR